MKAQVLIIVLAAAAAAAACDDYAALSLDATEADAAAGSDSDVDADEAIDAMTDPDTAIDATIDATSCVHGSRRCEGNDVTECQSGTWQTIASCPNLCAQGACVTPPSCSGGVTTCGVGSSETCCASLPVTGGTFARSYDGVSTGFTDDRYHATISTFHLDRFEVTSTRFQKFVDAYPLDIPVAGSGRNPHDASDPGWQTAWNAQLPATRNDLQTSLLCDGISAQQASDPIRCVSWYLAQAFCIWDGGRLPSEAEWNFAAAGGGEQRVYPWSLPASSTTISADHATYGASAPTRAGAHTLDGGRWGQRDLAGNVWEWALDYYASPYGSTSCNDCANHTASSGRVVRGGSFLNNATTVIAANRAASPPTTANRITGLRCARDPLP